MPIYVRFHATQSVEGPFDNEQVATLIAEGLIHLRDATSNDRAGPFQPIAESRDPAFHHLHREAFAAPEIASMGKPGLLKFKVIFAGAFALLWIGGAIILSREWSMVPAVLFAVFGLPVAAIIWFFAKFVREQRRVRSRTEQVLVWVVILMVLLLAGVIAAIALREPHR